MGWFHCLPAMLQLERIEQAPEFLPRRQRRLTEFPGRLAYGAVVGGRDAAGRAGVDHARHIRRCERHRRRQNDEHEHGGAARAGTRRCSACFDGPGS